VLCSCHKYATFRDPLLCSDVAGDQRNVEHFGEHSMDGVIPIR